MEEAEALLTPIPMKNPEKVDLPSAPTTVVEAEASPNPTPKENQQEVRPPSALNTRVEAETSHFSTSTEDLQDGSLSSAPIMRLGAEAPSPLVSTESQQIVNSAIPPINSAETEAPSTSATAEIPQAKHSTSAPAIGTGAEAPVPPVSAEDLQDEGAPSTPNQLMVAKARQRKGTSAAGIWQRSVQQPYNLRHKRKQNQEQLRGEKVKSSFKKLLGPSDWSEEDFEDLKPEIQTKDAEAQEEGSAYKAVELSDSNDQGDRTIVIDSTTEIEPTIVIHSTIVIDSTVSDAEAAAEGSTHMGDQTEAVDLSSEKGTVDRVNLNSPNIASFKKAGGTRSHPPSLDISNIELVGSASFRGIVRNDSSSRDPFCKAAEPSTSTPKEEQHQQAE